MYKIPANTVFMGKNLVFVPECHSTNTLAHEIGQLPSSVDGTAVITSNQTAGRGQRGNSWEAEPGKNLTFSVLLKPTFLAVKDQFFLNIISSLSIRDILRDKSDATVSIKWPNDILINGKKVCGILIENQIQGQQVSQSIVGIGLNVNQTGFAVPTATSLTEFTGRSEDLQSVFELIMQRLEVRYLQLREGKYDKLKEEYLAALFLRGTESLFASAEQQFQGTILGIDEIGKLVVDTQAGVRAFGLKEITYVR